MGHHYFVRNTSKIPKKVFVFFLYHEQLLTFNFSCDIGHFKQEEQKNGSRKLVIGLYKAP